METSTRSRSMAEQDRRKFMQQAQQSFSKNHEAIGGMKRDNDKLRADISILNGGTGIIAARSLGGTGADGGAGSTLKRLEEQDRKAQLQLDAEALQRHISYEKLRSEDLEKRLAVVRLETMDCRRVMGGVNIAADNAVSVDKQVRVLENRLDQALVDFNKALASNRALRQSIDNLRGERAVFSDIYRNLEAELHGRKRAMADVIETANRDYEERDALARQLEGLREAAREDSQKYNDQFERLDVMMTKYKAAREQQQQQLMLLQAQRAAAKIKQQDERTAAGMHVAGASQSPAMGGTLGTTKDGASSVIADPETGDALQDVIEQLKEGTGVQDLDVLYEQYSKAEEGNFSMYSFVNELNAEREGLEKEVGELKDQLAQCRTESQRHAALKALELELADTEQEHESLTLRTQEHKSTLDLVRVTTQGLFQKLGCSAELAEQQLGTTECTELNVLQFLGLIEQRTNEILFAANAAVQNEQRRSAANREEEERRQRERRANERVARLQAGEAVDDMGDVNDGASDAAGNTSALMASAGGAAAITSMDFIGVGPATAPGEVTSVAQFNRHRDLLPNTVGEGDGHGFDDDIDDSKPIDHARLRRDMPELVKKKKKDGIGMKKKKK